VWTPTLTGFGERHHLAGCVTGFDVLVDDVVNVLEFEDLHDVVLVGHSMGGVVIPRVAQAVPERIRRVVWLAAVVLDDGETLLSAVPQTPEVARAVTIGPDGVPRTDVQAMLDAILNDGTARDRAWVAARHRPYPPVALTEPGRLRAFLDLGLPTGYVVATEDRTIPPDLADRFAARLPGALRARVAAGHDCMMSRPDETAAALLQVT
jgi:pimeloyl-ACP methyl ester carboxylesterase